MKIINISKNYGNKQIIKKFSYSFDSNKRIAIIGPSGCGKTTLLNILIGIVKIDSGIVNSKGTISVKFQENRLLNWLNVYDNIRIVDKSKSRKDIEEILYKFGLLDEVLSLPKELSAGMNQRVSLARAIIKEADTYIFDEPFSAIDSNIKEKVICAIEDRIKNKKMIMVTHDIYSAIRLSDTILIADGIPFKILNEIENPLKRTERNFKNIIESEVYTNLATKAKM